jgi:mycoredoxin
MEKEIIIMYGTSFCGDTIRAKKVFDQYEIAYRWVNIDRDKEAEKIVKEINKGYRSVPTIIFPDGSMLVEPDKETLTIKFQELGLI